MPGTPLTESIPGHALQFAPTADQGFGTVPHMTCADIKSPTHSTVSFYGGRLGKYNTKGLIHVFGDKFPAAMLSEEQDTGTETSIQGRFTTTLQQGRGERKAPSRNPYFGSTPSCCISRMLIHE